MSKHDLVRCGAARPSSSAFKAFLGSLTGDLAEAVARVIRVLYSPPSLQVQCHAQYPAQQHSLKCRALQSATPCSHCGTSVLAKSWCVLMTHLLSLFVQSTTASKSATSASKSATSAQSTTTKVTAVTAWQHPWHQCLAEAVARVTWLRVLYSPPSLQVQYYAQFPAKQHSLKYRALQLAP